MDGREASSLVWVSPRGDAWGRFRGKKRSAARLGRHAFASTCHPSQSYTHPRLRRRPFEPPATTLLSRHWWRARALNRLSIHRNKNACHTSSSSSSPAAPGLLWWSPRQTRSPAAGFPGQLCHVASAADDDWNSHRRREAVRAVARRRARASRRPLPGTRGHCSLVAPTRATSPSPLWEDDAPPLSNSSAPPNQIGALLPARLEEKMDRPVG